MLLRIRPLRSRFPLPRFAFPLRTIMSTTRSFPGEPAAPPFCPSFMTLLTAVQNAGVTAEYVAPEGANGVDAHPLTCHPQASAAFPENTLASFEAAIKDGAEGIESGISQQSHSFFP